MRYFGFLLVFFLLSCGGEQDNSQSNEGNDNDSSSDTLSELNYDSLEVDNDNYTAEAYLDGPEEWFYITEEDVDYNDEVVYPEGAEFHIVPHVYESDGTSSEINEYMMAIAETGFELNSPYKGFSGPVKVYYNETKENVAAKFEVENGEPIGICTVWDPDGEIFIQRQYEVGTHDWISSTVEPFSVDWTFVQSESKLTINDSERAFSAEGDKQVVSIMPSMNYDSKSDNNLYKIMEKKTFENQFQLNGSIFNGILRAYFHPNSTTFEMYYELPFTDGYLDGNIKIYNDWGEMELHEVFVMGELDTVLYKLEYEGDVAKPIIYLYPSKEITVDVKLNFDGKLTTTYPAYNNGWKVKAKPDGTITDTNGKEYYALYWEGDNRKDFTIDKGFVVKGENTAVFLEESLAILGLNRREANEFIVYWLPLMKDNPYNLIHFSTSEYEEMAQLQISPKPETMIRVMMVYKPLKSPIDILPQDLNKLSKERKGFTVVEWGGSQFKDESSL
ncbi:hypothetical protein K6119_07635 [Paracrocinitomix mangrovi]|uniref:hypothetical protein n=1 Tax=Paracrocinitomix mangrovi TaxID=2862509 RepID=UPI001C8E87BB|nr:hypothetical protein [Paracrocinitomix mangrovi]UKN03386.1 hypothetical protein K6119_07635 [Paracrocinitomix mangrovi]